MTHIGSTTEDQDGLPKNIDRGPPEEDWKTPAELRGTMQDIAAAKSSMGQLATFKGIEERMKVLESMVDDMAEQYNRMVGMLMTLQGQFDQYQKQRAVELQSWLANGGSTTPEDMSGDND